MNCKCIIYFCFHILCINTASAFSNDSLPNSYGLRVLNTSKELKNDIKISEKNKMIDIQKLIPDIKLSLVYTGTHNFMHQSLYSITNTTFLRIPAAIALSRVQDELRKQNLSLKIWDAYRPYAVTLKMWDLIHDDRYVADPSKGSGHNKGIAVDLTIISIKDGKELDMGTGFDNFTDTAHQNFINLPENVLNNRKLLRTLMLSNGFKIFDTEWWHYYYGEGDFNILDLSFDELMKLSKQN